MVDEILVLGCLPCVECMARGILPYQGSVVEKCSQCGKEVWMGPEQRKLHETKKYMIVCLCCLADEFGEEAIQLLRPLTRKGQGE